MFFYESREERLSSRDWIERVLGRERCDSLIWVVELQWSMAMRTPQLEHRWGGEEGGLGGRGSTKRREAGRRGRKGVLDYTTSAVAHCEGI